MSDSEYIRQWRKTKAGQASMRKAKRREAARRAAVAALIKRYPLVFDALLQEELNKIPDQ